jgi:hypothetical protein
MARVPSVARGTIFSGTLSEFKYNNYDLIKNLIFNSTEAYNSFKVIPVFYIPSNRKLLGIGGKMQTDWVSVEF